LLDLFGQQMAVDILQTLPHEHKKREGLHAAYIGFSEFTALMHKFAEAYLAQFQPASTNDEAQESFEN
jgi:hypothetical protein